MILYKNSYQGNVIKLRIVINYFSQLFYFSDELLTR